MSAWTLARPAVVLVLLACSGCAIPPEFPPDDMHTGEEVTIERCFRCHVTGGGPRPHPSHWTEAREFKATRRDCLSCHRPSRPPPTDADGRER